MTEDGSARFDAMSADGLVSLAQLEARGWNDAVEHFFDLLRSS
ncbi:MAG TPA: hypothetical protein VFV34_27750 [Blastocatellia bacterium]|nr:hypothetical protein [Blastocatellia bacterium]